MRLIVNQINENPKEMADYFNEKIGHLLKYNLAEKDVTAYCGSKYTRSKGEWNKKEWGVINMRLLHGRYVTLHVWAESPKGNGKYAKWIIDGTNLLNFPYGDENNELFAMHTELIRQAKWVLQQYLTEHGQKAVIKK